VKCAGVCIVRNKNNQSTLASGEIRMIDRSANATERGVKSNLVVVCARAAAEVF
jgi:hypothetical protein